MLFDVRNGFKFNLNYRTTVWLLIIENSIFNDN